VALVVLLKIAFTGSMPAPTSCMAKMKAMAARA
jgi:hypothetical protein